MKVGKSMGDLFGAFQKVSPQNKSNSFDQIAAYEEYYMKLLKRYQGDNANNLSDIGIYPA